MLHNNAIQQLVARLSALAILESVSFCALQTSYAVAAQMLGEKNGAIALVQGKSETDDDSGSKSGATIAASAPESFAKYLNMLIMHDDDSVAEVLRNMENTRHHLYKEIRQGDDEAQQEALAQIHEDQRKLQPVLYENDRVNEAAFQAGYTKYPAPYINQYDPQGWEPDYIGNMSCGKTSMAMVCRAFGKGKDYSNEELILHMGKLVGSPNGGRTRLRGWYTWASDYGLKAKIHGPGADTDWIAGQLGRGRLVVCLGAYNGMPPHLNLERIALTQTGHYILVIGTTPDGKFLINDPADPRAKVLTPRELAGFINYHDLIPTSGIGSYARGYQIALYPRD